MTPAGFVEALYSRRCTRSMVAVPELASRDHIRKTLPLIDRVLSDACLDKTDIDAVAYTSGSMLLGALIVVRLSLDPLPHVVGCIWRGIYGL